MDRISGLSDELLIEILSYLPTKDAVSTCILSKRWEFLWMWLPELDFDTENYTLSECERLRCFLDRNLPLHKAPVIGTLILKFTNSRFTSEQVKMWILIAVSRQVDYLNIYFSSYSRRQQNILPSSLFTSKSLESLTLHGDILLDVPRMASLPSLTCLSLHEVENGKSLQRLLSICPALETLSLDFADSENMEKINIIFPSLEYLSLFISFRCELDGLVINAPSLKKLLFLVRCDKIHSYLIENMPKLEEAHIDCHFPDTDNLIRSITSVKRLTICSEAVYGDGFLFNQLDYLKLCVGRKYSSNLLIRLLKDSPNLRELDLYEMEDHGFDGLSSWKEPSSVPECIVSSLEIFIWSDYHGRPHERDLAVYILKNACHLKTATISSNARVVCWDVNLYLGDMDSINGLSDDLLVKILSFLPTKVAVSTSVLSKRWESLWMWLPKLEFDTGCYTESEFKRLRYFLDRNLPLHRAPVIESFCLDLNNTCLSLRSKDVKLWVQIAVSRHLRELEIAWYYFDNPKIQNILPSSLYNCKSLVRLELIGPILLDIPRMVCLSSLKTLFLEVETLNGESIRRFISICPVLEDLTLDLFECLEMGKINITVPSLQSLTIYTLSETCLIDELVIDTPCLKYLKLEVHIDESSPCLFKNMPKLEEAYVDFNFPHIESLIGSITSVKRLSICSDTVYGGGDEGFVFNQLEHLKLCVRREYSLNLIIRFLQDSPNLRVLHLNKMHLSKMEEHHKHYLDGLVCWNEPSTVPKCMVSNLQTFNWSEYYGRPLERDIAVYILKNGRGLKTATISSDERFVPKLEMLKELSLSSRASTTCQLIFN